MIKDIYTPSEAIEYLRTERKIILSVEGLRKRRSRDQAKASRVLTNNSLWTKADLDAIEPSKWTKRVAEVQPQDAALLDELAGTDSGPSSSVQSAEKNASSSMLITTSSHGLRGHFRGLPDWLMSDPNGNDGGLPDDWPPINQRVPVLAE